MPRMPKTLPPLDSARRPAKEIKALADLRPDPRNANAHTERGLGLLEHSLRRYGAGRSIVVDRNGMVIAGGATLEKAADLGLAIEVVRTRGDRLVVVQREDLDLADDGNADARELAIADNRVGELDLAWNPDALNYLQTHDTDLTAFFTDIELSDIIGDGSTQETVQFKAEKKVCQCCKTKCRKSCGCWKETE